MAMASQDGKTLYPWIADQAEVLANMRKARRLRVQLNSKVYDLDLAKGDGMPQWGKC
jgi:hypothetical protein